jgi:hypothetical protein
MPFKLQRSGYVNSSADYTTDEIQLRLHKYFKEKAEAFGKRRFQIVKYIAPLPDG